MVIVRLTVVWQTNLMAQTHEQNQSFSDRALEKNNSNADYFSLNVAHKWLNLFAGKASLSNFRFCLFCDVSYSILYKRGNWTELTFAKTSGIFTVDGEDKLKQHQRRRQRERQ